MSEKVNVPRSGIALSGLLHGLIFAVGAQVAFAAPNAQPSENGLLKLPNVKIQNATPQQIETLAGQKSSSASKSGVRAYKDKETGKLRDQYPEEMQQESAAAVVQSSEPAAYIAPAKGGVAALLDESFMTDAVATKDASGHLHMDCVTGKGAVAKALVTGKAGKAHRHDR